MKLTEVECIESVNFAIGLVIDVPFKENAWNAQQFLIKEHCLGWGTAGGTVYKCNIGFNIDFDIRCECCGNILALGSVDIHGPIHQKSRANSSGVTLARSFAEIHSALGSSFDQSERISQHDAAIYIYSRLKSAKPCPCSFPE